MFLSHEKNKSVAGGENRPRTWRIDKLIPCFNDCLSALSQCLENGDLSQYFIPQQNLFDTKVQGEVRRKLIRVVRGLVQEGWICLLRCAPFTNIQIGCMHEVPRCPCYSRNMNVQSKMCKGNKAHQQLPEILSRTWKSIFVTSRKDCFDHTMSHMKSVI